MIFEVGDEIRFKRIKTHKGRRWGTRRGFSLDKTYKIYEIKDDKCFFRNNHGRKFFVRNNPTPAQLLIYQEEIDILLLLRKRKLKKINEIAICHLFSLYSSCCNGEFW